MDSRQVGIRLPQDLFDAVEQMSNDQGVSRTEAIVSLLRRGLGQAAAEPSPAPGEADELRSRLDSVERRLTAVERQLLTKNAPRRTSVEQMSNTTPGDTAPTQPAPIGHLTQGQALTAAGYPGNPSNARRDLGNLGSTPEQWLSDRGWIRAGRRYRQSK